MLFLFISCILAILLSDYCYIYPMEQNTNEEFLSGVPETRAKNFIEGIAFNKADKNKHKYVKFDDFGISWSGAGETLLKQSSHHLSDSPNQPLKTFENNIKDDRRPVPNTEIYPFRCFGQVESYQGKKKHGGSAILVGSHHALTAAHNVYDHETDSWRTKIIVNFGRNGCSALATCEVVRAYIPESYMKAGNSDFDLALIVLDSPIGLTLGWLGCMFALGDKVFREKALNVTGYPGDKGYKHLYTMANKFHELKDERIFYKIFTSAGNSGSPIWMDSETDLGKQPVVIGIHTHGESEKGSGTSGARLTEKKFKQIMGWIGETEQFEINPSDKTVKQQFTNTDLLLMGKAAYEVKDYPQALNCFGRLERQSECSFEKAAACTNLAKMYLLGKGVTVDKRRTVFYCQIVRNQLNMQQNAPQEMKHLLAVAKEMTNSSPVDELREMRNKKVTRMCVAAVEGNLQLVMLLYEKGALWDVDGCSSTPLHCAVQNAHSAIVQHLLSEGIDVELRDDEDKTALWIAVECNKLDIAELLIRYYANINVRGHNEKTLLHLALAAADRKSIVDFLLNQGIDSNLCDNDNKAPLWIALNKGDLESAQLMINHGAVTHWIDPQGDSLIHYVIDTFSGDEDMLMKTIDYLLELKANLNTQDASGLSPLSKAINKYSENFILFLMNRGAQVNLVDKDGNGPLHSALQNSSKEKYSIVQLLLDCGADVNLKTNDGLTPLFIAVKNSFLEGVRLLLARGGSHKVLDKDEITLLHEVSDEKIAELLLESGAEVNAENRWKQTPFHLAVYRGLIGVANRLITKGANVDHQTLQGNTALHFAALQGNKKMVAWLLDMQVKPALKNVNKCTPLKLLITKMQELENQKEKQKKATPGIVEESPNFVENGILCRLTPVDAKAVALLLEPCTSSKDLNAMMRNAIKRDHAASVNLILQLNFDAEELTLLTAIDRIKNDSVSGVFLLGNTALRLSDVLTNLLKKNGNPNSFDSETGDTLILTACKKNAPALVKILLDAGANPFISNQSGENAYDATLRGTKVRCLLDKYKRDLKVRYRDGRFRHAAYTLGGSITGITTIVVCMTYDIGIFSGSGIMYYCGPCILGILAFACFGSLGDMYENSGETK